ncbi:hypothetical protein PW52_13285 [Tamlana sedimentorum]|uniref:Thioredoxin domain-containing protein n=1 Tax=Neotamlana sedimentorum TaxID=1435349 RepID=A0A0D7W857_9FLAO|nr:redoxin domain-containing protein [Tamlana sedimentorum]KJD34878.1 hypothetical protein PW52_13285 [Tamlana sedimentorum]
MKWFLSIIILTFTFLSCKNINKDVNYAYIGGEIINPNTNFIVLEKDEKLIDTIKLDGRNRFIYKIDNLDPGFYSFTHGGEFQMILLEPQDSLLLRLNTIEFDESLVFSGIGKKKNNYFINEFLEHEKQEKYIFKICQLKPENYIKHIDSIKALKTNHLELFKKKHKPSKLFSKIAQANIDFDYYSHKEMYPFIHYGRDKVAILNSLPEHFYDYRKNINYNDEFFSKYHNYKAFLRKNVSNLALQAHAKHSQDKPFKHKELCYNLARLNIIDSLVSDPTIKDELLYHFAIDYLSKNQNIEDNEVLLKSYLNKSKDDKGKVIMERINASINRLKTGEKIPEFTVTDYKQHNHDISSIIKKNTVICFWSQAYYKHFNDSYKRIKELKLKYPEINFIRINIDDYNLQRSKNILENHNYISNNEYKLQNPGSAKESLAIYPVTKTFIVDKNNTIVSSNSNLFSFRFEKELLGLINR